MDSREAKIAELRRRDKIRQLRERDAQNAAAAPQEVAEPGFLDKFIPSGDASLGENTSAAWDTVKSLGSDVQDGLDSMKDNIPIVSPLAKAAGNAIGAAVDPTRDYSQVVADENAESAARAERSPVANVVGGLAGGVANPLNAVSGFAGVGAGLAGSAADMGLRNTVGGEDISGEDAGKALAVEGILGSGLAGLGKLGNSKMYDDLALKYGKKTLGGTKRELEKLDVRSDALDNSVKRLLDEDVFNKPFQTKQDIFDTISTKKAQSGEAGGDLFTATAKPANQAATYDQLMTRAQVARNKGQKEIADKLESEAKIIRDIDSKPLDIDQPLMASPDQMKSIEMQNTDLDPEILKSRKTTLDKQAYGTMGTNDPAASAAANEMRDMQYGLLDDDASAFLKEENKRFGDLATAEKLAAKSAAGEISNGGGLIGNVKKGIGSTAGAMIGNAILPGGVGAAGGMAAGGYAAKLLQDHGPQLAAYGFNKASKILQNEGWAKTLSQAGERGGSQGVSTAHFLLTQRDPAYRKAHQEDQEAERNK